MCAPGVQDVSRPPFGSAKVNATASGVTISRLVMTAVIVRRTGPTCAGFHRETTEKPLNTVTAPHSMA